MPKNPPKISVIIPTYNRRLHISRALESVLSQSFVDFEIIVVDDGSSDDTRNILNPYMNRIKYIYQTNSGVSAARNRGIKEALGEYIAFLDSDDYWDKEKLAIQVAILDRNPHVGIVYSRMPILNERGQKIGMKPAGVSGRNFQELLEVWGDLPTSTIMVRRSCFDKAGLFDTDLLIMEDIDMWLRIARDYELYEVENKVLAYYCRHEGQITGNRSRMFNGLVKVYTKIYKTCPEAPRALMLKRIVENRYLLAKENYLEGDFKNASKNAFQAIKMDPFLGLIFVKTGDHWLAPPLKLMKPYGLLLASLIKSRRSTPAPAVISNI